MTVYVPEYINTTNEVEKVVEVEKIIDNTTILETGYEWWDIVLGIIVGIGFGWFMFKEEKENKDATS